MRKKKNHHKQPARQQPQQPVTQQPQQPVTQQPQQPKIGYQFQDPLPPEEDKFFYRPHICFIVSILCTFFCGSLLSVPAIIVSKLAMGELSIGNYADARDFAKIAMVLNIVGITIMLIILIIGILSMYTDLGDMITQALDNLLVK